MKAIYPLLILFIFPCFVHGYWIEDFESETKATLSAQGWEYFPTNGYSMTSTGGCCGQYIRANAGIGNLESLATPCMVPEGPLDTVRFNYIFFAGVSGYINVGYQNGALPAGTGITWIGTAPIVYSWTYKKFPYVVPSYTFVRIVISFNTLDASCKIGVDNFISYKTLFWGNCANVVAPVQLSLFTAYPAPQNEYLSNPKINLNWRTESEVNSSKFEILRSLNGEMYETIAEVDAAGSSITAIDYLFEDQNPPRSTLYYRLRMMDVDGSSEYSSILRVDIPYPYYFSFENNELTYLCHVPGELLVTNINGWVLYRKSITDGETVNMSEFNSGLYLVSLSGSTENTWKLFVE